MALSSMRRIAAYEQNSTPLLKVAGGPVLCLDCGCAMFAVQESALDRRNNTSREDTPGR